MSGLERYQILVGNGNGGRDIEVEGYAGLAWGIWLRRAKPDVDGSLRDQAIAFGSDDGKFPGTEEEADLL